ncbi:MAG UNVERIFIED_CONTAM: hypothetical protein LVT10_00120 [Anaerolineae bacterium]|jgi:ABC-type Fe3+ transport system permease subunit
MFAQHAAEWGGAPLPNWDRMGEMAGEGFRVGLAQLPIWFIALFTFIIPPLGLVGMAVAYFMTNEGYCATSKPTARWIFPLWELWKSFRQNMSASLSYGVWAFVLTVILTLSLARSSVASCKSPCKFR